MAAFISKPGDEEENIEGMHEMMGPGQADQQIRQAIQFCWMSLPKGRRTVDEVEAQVRRIVDRALGDFREDGQAFGRK